jgi:predicted acetyltransferase
MSELVVPGEEHRDQVVDVLHIALNLGPEFARHRGSKLSLDKMRGVVDGGRIVAVAGDRRFRQWFGGRELEMCGIWGVATLPEHRGRGLATRAIERLLREARERGDQLTALFPAILRPYRGLGYELAGSYVQHRVRLDDLPHLRGSLAVEPYDLDRDLDGVRACYLRAMAPHNGPIDCDDEGWWPERIMGNPMQLDHQRAVVVRGDDGIEGYLSFANEADKGSLDISFKLACRHLVASSAEGLRSLIEYARGFRGLGTALVFTGAPDEPLAMLVDEQNVSREWEFRWMLRLLDVPGALEGRGYPAVSEEAVIEVDDPMFPENRGPWRISAEDGKVSVSPTEGARVRPIAIGTLSSMYSGYLSPFDAARIGLMDADDPAVPALARLFAGPAPFMLDWF